MSPLEAGTQVLCHISGTDLLSDPNLARIGMLMFEHYSEGGGTWGRQCMIEIGIPEDVADMYIEKLRRELKDPRLKLSVKGYVLFLLGTDAIAGA